MCGERCYPRKDKQSSQKSSIVSGHSGADDTEKDATLLCFACLASSVMIMRFEELL